MLEALKALRENIRVAEKDTKTVAEFINRGTGGREVALALTHLQNARHWVGEAMEQLGYTDPGDYRDLKGEVQH